jgi:hypothetical protein
MDYNEDDKPFMPETLKACAREAEDLRAECLFGIASEGADPFAEQQFLAALAYLDLAHRHFALAGLTQARALADGVA